MSTELQQLKEQNKLACWAARVSKYELFMKLYTGIKLPKPSKKNRKKLKMPDLWHLQLFIALPVPDPGNIPSQKIL